MLNDVLCFGKHKGKSQAQIMEEDASYLVWAENKGLIKIEEAIRQEVERKADREESEFFRSHCDGEVSIEY